MSTRVRFAPSPTGYLHVGGARTALFNWLYARHVGGKFLLPPGEIDWADAVHGPISFQGEDIKDFVILRSDRTPIYNFAVVVDDIDMKITHVLRGDDHISNTPKQIALYRSLGAALPVFGHVPMIHGPDGKKLSK